MRASDHSPEPAPADEPRRAQRLSRAVRVLVALAIFGIAGPPIGGLVAWLTMGARDLHSPLPFLTGAYAEAAALAIGVGVLVAAASFAGRTSALVPLVGALLINVLMFAVTGSLSFSSSFDPDTLLRVAYVFIPPSLVAAMACWLLTRELLKP
jgi:hypothetical protein